MNIVRTQGFSLVEITLSIALLAALGGISLPVAHSMLVRSDLDAARLHIAQSLQRAQSLAASGASEAMWGVHIQNGAVIVFRGSDFATRDSTFDEVSEFSSSLVIGGASDIIFNRLNGLPIAGGSITLTSTQNESRTITTNAIGTTDY